MRILLLFPLACFAAWGFLAVRLPMPEDEQWAADRLMAEEMRARRKTN